MRQAGQGTVEHEAGIVTMYDIKRTMSATITLGQSRGNVLTIQQRQINIINLMFS